MKKKKAQYTYKKFDENDELLMKQSFPSLADAKRYFKDYLHDYISEENVEVLIKLGELRVRDNDEIHTMVFGKAV